MLFMLAFAGCGSLARPSHDHAGSGSIAIKELRGLRLDTTNEFGQPSILPCGRDSIYVTWLWRPSPDRFGHQRAARDTLFIGLTRGGAKWDRKAVLAVGQGGGARLLRSARGVYALLDSPMRLLRIHEDLSSTFVADLDYPATGAALAVDVAFKDPDSLAAVYNIVTGAPDGRAVESIVLARWQGAMRPSKYEVVSQVPYTTKVAPTAALSFVDGLPRLVINQAVGPCVAGVAAPDDARPAGLPAVVEYRLAADGAWQARTLTRGVPEFWTMASAVGGRQPTALLQSEDRLACVTSATGGRTGLASLHPPTPVYVSTDASDPGAALVSSPGGEPLAIAAWLGRQDGNQLSLLRPRIPEPLAVLLDIEPTSDVFLTGIDLRTAVAGDVRSVGDASPWRPRESASSLALGASPGGGALAVVTAEAGTGNRLRVYRLLQPE